MRTLISLLACTSLLSLTSAASADDHRTFGFQADVGVPDGVAVGLAVRPVLPWLRLDLSATYNGVAPGVRGGVTLDPVKYWVAPTFTFEGGYAFQGKVPGVTNSPNVGYDYVNFHVGLEFGNRNRWRFFIHAGPSYINGNVTNVGPIISTGDHSITVADPSISAWIFPTAKLGVAVFF